MRHLLALAFLLTIFSGVVIAQIPISLDSSGLVRASVVANDPLDALPLGTFQTFLDLQNEAYSVYLEAELGLYVTFNTASVAVATDGYVKFFGGTAGAPSIVNFTVNADTVSVTSPLAGDLSFVICLTRNSMTACGSSMPVMTLLTQASYLTFSSLTASGAGVLPLNDARLQFPSGDWSIESYFYATRSSNERYLIPFATASSTQQYQIYSYVDAHNNYFRINSGSGYMDTPLAFPENQWCHLVLRSLSGTISVVFNGVSSTLTDYSYGPFESGEVLMITGLHFVSPLPGSGLPTLVASGTHGWRTDAKWALNRVYDKHLSLAEISTLRDKIQFDYDPITPIFSMRPSTTYVVRGTGTVNSF